MAQFEQYPDYAMETDENGNRITKPFVTGPSPLAMGLMTAGLGILAQPEDNSGWVTEGSGFDFSNIAKGGLLGLQAFGEGHTNLNNQRKDFYNAQNARYNVALNAQKAQKESEEEKRKTQQFPALIQQLQALNNPSIKAKLPALMQMGRGNINTAYSAASNLLSAVEGKKFGSPYYNKANVLVKDILNYDGTKTGTSEYIAQGTTAGANKPSVTLNDVRGLLINNSSNMREYAAGMSAQRPTLHPSLYNSYYHEKMRADKDEVVSTAADGVTTTTFVMKRISDLMDPRTYAIAYGMTPTEAENSEIPVEVESTINYTQKEKQNIAAAKDFAKISVVALAEKAIQSIKYNPLEASLASQYIAYATSGAVPMASDARTYEASALTGATMLGYLFSGATVKDEENRRMRTLLYPFPGDDLGDVQRKAKFRNAIINLYQSFIPDDIKKRIFTDVMDETLSTADQIKALETSTTSNVGSEITRTIDAKPLTSKESKQKLDALWPEGK